jgi:hypothetical protein
MVVREADAAGGGAPDFPRPVSSARPRTAGDFVPRGLGALAIGACVPLLLWDAAPQLFPDAAHGVLSAVALVAVGLAAVAHAAVRRTSRAEIAKSMILALSFFFWAANQLWPSHPLATLFNDVAVAGFVLDVVLVLVGWPAPSATKLT